MMGIEDSLQQAAGNLRPYGVGPKTSKNGPERMDLHG